MGGNSVSCATDVEALYDELKGCNGGNNSGEDTSVHRPTPSDETIDMECPGSCI